MKTIKLKERVYNSFTEKYELDGIYIGCAGFRPGILSCYLMATLPEISLTSFVADEEGELGSSRNIICLEGEEFKKKFPTVNDFMKEMINDGIQTWELNVLICGVSVKITGQAWRTAIGVIYPVGKALNLVPLLGKVEDASFEIHNYDSNLVDNTKNLFHLSQKSAIRFLNKLKSHQDLFEEFQNGCRLPEFLFPEDGICVQNYNAKALHDDYPLSPLGAYNYLIYLRENPEEALKDLKEGLPRK